MVLLGVALSILLVLYALRFSVDQQDLFNPIALFIIPYAICFLIYTLVYVELEPPNWLTIIIYIMGMFSFVFGVLLAKYAKITTRYGERMCTIKVNKGMLYIYIVIGVATFFLGLVQAIRVGGGGSIGSILTNIRINEVQGGGRNFLTKYGSIFLYVSTIVNLYYKRINHIRLKIVDITLVLFLFVSVAFTMARTELLTYFMSIIFLFFETRERKSDNRTFVNLFSQYKKVIVLLLVFILVFLWAGNNSGRAFSMDFKDPNFVLWGYSGHGFVNLNKYAVVQQYKQDWWGVFTPVASVLTRLFPHNGAEMLGSYIGDSSYNTFSSFGFEYMSMGLLGLVIINFLYGFFCMWLYKKSKKQKGYYTIFYATYIFTMVISFFAYQAMNTFYVYVAILLSFIQVRTVPKCYSEKNLFE